MHGRHGEGKLEETAISSWPPVGAREATRAYYEENARAFEQRTRDRDMADLYRPFLALVPAGGCILDAGCGPGRDAVAFRDAGYCVTAFDASAAMVALASERLGSGVMRLPFSALEYELEFDGVWACASLLHVSRAEMPGVVERIHRALKTQGVLFASFKLGRSEEFREGRWFNDYEEGSLAALFQSPRWTLLRVWSTDEVRGDRHVMWVNALAQRA